MTTGRTSPALIGCEDDAITPAMVAASAQPVRQPPHRDIARLLKSNEPSEHAWGATLAADAGDNKYVPDILRLLGGKRTTESDKLVPYYAFDALLRLEAEIPEKVLRPLVKEYASRILVLAKEGSYGYAYLLPELLDFVHDDYERWKVMQLLRRYPMPEYTERVLREWTVDVYFEIASPPKVLPNGDTIEEIAATTSNFSGVSGGGHCGLPEVSFRFPALPKRSSSRIISVAPLAYLLTTSEANMCERWLRECAFRGGG